MDKMSELSKPVRIHRDWNSASMCHCGKCDRWEMTIADADGVKTCASCYDAEWLSEWQDYAEEADKRIAELEAIRGAAEKLVRCKGRYHSEQNYRALAALFGVTTPDLPPVDGDSEAVIAELRAKLATPVRLPGSFYPDGDIDLPLVVELDEAVEAIRTAGFTVEGNE